MIRFHPKQNRILAIALSSSGFGFAVLEGESQLIDWGRKIVAPTKTNLCLQKVEAFMTLYSPTQFVLEDHLAKDFHRHERIRNLNMQLVELSVRRNVEFRLISQSQVRRTFFKEEKGTKYGVAEILAQQFPSELGSRLPRKRRPWTSEDPRMAIFDAVALVMVACLVK